MQNCYELEISPVFQPVFAGFLKISRECKPFRGGGEKNLIDFIFLLKLQRSFSFIEKNNSENKLAYQKCFFYRGLNYTPWKLS
jgi:hypothetical protein